MGLNYFLVEVIPIVGTPIDKMKKTYSMKDECQFYLSRNGKYDKCFTYNLWTKVKMIIFTA